MGRQDPISVPYPPPVLAVKRGGVEQISVKFLRPLFPLDYFTQMMINRDRITLTTGPLIRMITHSRIILVIKLPSRARSRVIQLVNTCTPALAVK